MLKGIDIGRLDTRLKFESLIPTVDELGNKPTVTYGSPFYVWGKLKTSGSSESFESNQQVGNRSCEVIIRYRSGINEQMRFTDIRMGDLWYVKGIESNVREGYCRLQAEKRDNQ
jgi:head-tail adaptor